jgi:hypothetical protein
MHHKTIDLQSWADIHDELEVTTQRDLGAAMLTAGTHLALGEVIAVCFEEYVVLLSEHPALIVPELRGRSRLAPVQLH